MKRALVMVGAGVALATALMVTLTTGAAAAPLGPVAPSNVAQGENGPVNVYYRGHRSGWGNGYRSGWGYGYRRGPSFGFYLGAPAYYGYTRNCWWSHRWHRRVCSY